MITLFTGAPGAGKTAALVDLLSKLEGDRPLFVDGLNGLKLPHHACDATKWPEELPDGAILVIDEVQRMWRPRGPGAKVPPEVQALETHRHRGIDVYLTTQAPRLLDANVRALVGRHVHIRDTGWLGRHWYEWPEVNDSMAWKTCPNKRSYKLPRSAFGLYKSSSLHTKPVRKTPVIKYLAALVVVGALVGAGLVVKTLTADRSAVTADPASKPAITAAVLHSPASGEPAAFGGFVDARVAFMPRISDKPETAPAYDGLRTVVNMPRIVGGLCRSSGECVCYTQQGTRAEMSARACKSWLDNRPFDPYTVPVPERPPVIAGAEKGAADTPSSGAQKAPEQLPALSIPVPTSGAVNVLSEARREGTAPSVRPVQATTATGAAQSLPALSLQNPYRKS